jgi:transcriptional regulator with XRE-family HTH domain
VCSQGGGCGSQCARPNGWRSRSGLGYTPSPCLLSKVSVKLSKLCAAEAARRTGVDQSNLSKYERNAKGITTATLDRILDAYETTLAELAAILREVQGGRSIHWIVPGEVSAADLTLVVRKVLGKDWDPDEPKEEETAPDEELPNSREDDDG